MSIFAKTFTGLLAHSLKLLMIRHDYWVELVLLNESWARSIYFLIFEISSLGNLMLKLLPSKSWGMSKWWVYHCHHIGLCHTIDYQMGVWKSLSIIFFKVGTFKLRRKFCPQVDVEIVEVKTSEWTCSFQLFDLSFNLINFVPCLSINFSWRFFFILRDLMVVILGYRL